MTVNIPVKLQPSPPNLYWLLYFSNLCPGRLSAFNQTEPVPNWSETLETRFAIMNDTVVVVSQRAVADLAPGEISRAITLVATIADDNDEILQETFGNI